MISFSETVSFSKNVHDTVGYRDKHSNVIRELPGCVMSLTDGVIVHVRGFMEGKPCFICQESAAIASMVFSCDFSLPPASAPPLEVARHHNALI